MTFTFFDGKDVHGSFSNGRSLMASRHASTSETELYSKSCNFLVLVKNKQSRDFQDLREGSIYCKVDWEREKGEDVLLSDNVTWQ